MNSSLSLIWRHLRLGIPVSIISFKSVAEADESLGLATISDNGDNSLRVDIDDGDEMFCVVFNCNVEL